MKALIKFSFLFMACFCFSGIVAAQQTGKQVKEAALEGKIRDRIENKTYTFNATYVLPMRGGQHYLTSEYDLRITKDSVIAFLPYFGQTYQQAPLTPEESGIMFTATKFDYKIEPMKKGGWHITILPANIKFVSKMELDVFKNGSANLIVLSNFRDVIKFDGDVKN